MGYFVFLFYTSTTKKCFVKHIKPFFLFSSSYSRVVSRYPGLVLLAVGAVCTAAIAYSAAYGNMPDFTEPQAVRRELCIW